MWTERSLQEEYARADQDLSVSWNKITIQEGIQPPLKIVSFC